MWSDGTTGAQRADLAAGGYSVTATDANGCQQTFEFDLTEPAAITFSSDRQEITCLQEFGSLTISEVEGGVAPYIYSLNGAIGTTSPILTGIAAGQHTLTVEDANGCIGTEELTFNAAPEYFIYLGEDETIRLGESIDIDPEINFDPVEFTWRGNNFSCDTCLMTTIMPTETTQYALTAQNEEGCTVTGSLLITVEKGYDIYLPTAFSPDSDGINEAFFINAGDNVETVMSFSVYSRWGEPIYQLFNFSPNNPDFGWKGDHNGQMLNTGVYVWQTEILFTDGHTKIFSGDVTLLRD